MGADLFLLCTASIIAPDLMLAATGSQWMECYNGVLWENVGRLIRSYTAIQLYHFGLAAAAKLFSEVRVCQISTIQIHLIVHTYPKVACSDQM